MFLNYLNLFKCEKYCDVLKLIGMENNWMLTILRTNPISNCCYKAILFANCK